jgi:hypothetical protein
MNNSESLFLAPTIKNRRFSRLPVFNSLFGMLHYLRLQKPPALA